MKSNTNKAPHFFFFIGPAGSGKSSLGKKFQKIKSFKFIEGDTFHSKKNIKKMINNKKLNFNDRKPWLKKINKYLINLRSGSNNYVISCSALKKRYRHMLSNNIDNCYFIYLKCNKKKLFERNLKRKHFFPISLLKDQIYSFQFSNDLITLDSSTNLTRLFLLSKKKIHRILNN